MGITRSAERPRLERISIAELERRLRNDATTDVERRGARHVHEENTRFFRFADLDAEVMPVPAESRKLLRAAALRDPAALQAWLAIESVAIPLDRLPLTLRDLLPAVYASLHRLGVYGDASEPCKRAYLRTLSRNRRLLLNVRDTLATLDAEHINLVVMDGAVLLPKYHHDWGARAMPDVAIWIQKADLLRAVEILRASGWIPRDRLTRAEHRPSFARFRSDAGDLTVRWRLLPHLYQPETDRAAWTATIPFDLETMTLRALSPTDQLFEILAGAELARVYRDDDGLRWIVDAMAVCLEAPDDIDWARLSRLAQSSAMAVSIGRRLNRLRNELDAPVPPSVLGALDGWLPTLVERIEAATVELRDVRARRLLNAVGHFLRLRHHPRYRPAVRGALRFLRDLWDLDRTSQLPPALARRAIHHLRALLTPP